MKKKKRLPYALSNYEKLIRENYYYIDKTAYIEKIEDTNNPVFLRPRRFGKTLFTQMLKWYYDIKAKDRFEELFGDLYIGKNTTPKHNSLFVLTLNFSGMDTFADDEMLLQERFNRSVMVRFEGFLNYYADLLDLNTEQIKAFSDKYSNNSAAGLSKIVELVDKAGGKLFVSIDEYDSLTNALAIRYRYDSKDTNMYLKILDKGGFFRTFFEALKAGGETAIDNVYITGILPITISDMKSGYNQATWITFEPDFVYMLGITQSEFDDLIDNIYADYQLKTDKQKLKQTIKKYYNGYRFILAGEDVYNTTMTLYFLNYVVKYDQYPPYFDDKNTRINYNQISFLFGENISERDEVISKLTCDKSLIHTKTLDVVFDMSDYKEGKYITEGLFYSGIVTYGDFQGQLVIPNLVTYTFALDYFEKVTKFDRQTFYISKWMFNYIKTGDIPTLLKGFFADIILKFPGDFFANVNESFFHGMFFHTIFNNMTKDLYEILPEFNLAGGTVDLMVRSYPEARVMHPLNDLFELKNTAKSASDAELNAKLKQAIEQLERYKSGEYATWRGIAVAFRGNKDFIYQIV